MDWCAVCSTLHLRRETCPGPLDATGPETETRRLRVYTGRFESFGILTAPVEGHWRARVVTLPRMLWSVPGRRDTIKFFGETKDEAERRAVAFIVEHCRSRGHRILDPDEPRHVPPTSAAEKPEQPLVQREPRLPHSVPARFGAKSVDHRARTADLSRSGLFLATGRPLPARTEIRIVLEVSPFEIPMRGTVAWSRIEASEGKPVGMGVKLAVPPSMYLRYVDRLIEPEDDHGGDPESCEGENPG